MGDDGRMGGMDATHLNALSKLGKSVAVRSLNSSDEEQESYQEDRGGGKKTVLLGKTHLCGIQLASKGETGQQYGGGTSFLSLLPFFFLDNGRNVWRPLQVNTPYF